MFYHNQDWQAYKRVIIRKLLRQSLGRLGRALLEDCFQDACLKVLGRAPEREPIRDLHRYLYRLTLRLAARRWEEQRGALAVSPTDQIPPSPERSSEEHARALRLLSGLSHMAERERKILSRVLWLGQNYEQFSYLYPWLEPDRTRRIVCAAIRELVRRMEREEAVPLRHGVRRLWSDLCRIPLGAPPGAPRQEFRRLLCAWVLIYVEQLPSAQPSAARLFALCRRDPVYRWIFRRPPGSAQLEHFHREHGETIARLAADFRGKSRP